MNYFARLSLLIGLIACGRGATQGAAVAPAVPKDTTLAKQLPAPDVVTVTGIVTADQTSQVAASVGGKVIALLVKRGQRVRAGEVLARLDSKQQALGALEARANLAMVEAQRLQADDECKRAQALFQQGAITKSQFERESVACQAAAQSVAAATARTQAVSKSVADGSIRAPFDGVVADTWVTPGEFVGPGSRIATLLDDIPLKVELSVTESIVPRLAVGQLVDVQSIAQIPGQAPISAQAKIVRLGPEISRMTRSLTAEAVFEKPSAMIPGMFVEAAIHVGMAELPAIPATSVVKRGQTWRAFVARNGYLHEQVVQVGRAPAEGMVSIVRGIQAGDEVVTTIDESIVDGLRIK